jgi:hypothetical protein
MTYNIPSTVSPNVTFLNSTNDIARRAGLFVPSEHLHLPPNFFWKLKKYGAANILTEESEIIVVSLSMIKKDLPNVGLVIPKVNLRSAHLEMSQVQTSGPTAMRQEIVDVDTIQVRG